MFPACYEAENDGSLMGMLVGRLRVAVGLVAVLVGGRGMLLSLVVLADFVVMGRLVVVMGGGGMACSRFMMMLGRGVLSLVGH
jgi:hypothetical protein